MKTFRIYAVVLCALAVSACSQGLFAGTNSLSSKGSVCGSNQLEGRSVSEIEAPNQAYGIKHPVEITSVAGVHLSQPATLNCATALTLATYVTEVAKPVIGNAGGGLSGLEVAASYVYRTRNNQSGARMSEHALGNAIDISAFVLADGKEFVVEEDWGLAVMKELHDDACGPFGTVLGPDSDRFHYNHFHFDTAAYRSGDYCR